MLKLMISISLVFSLSASAGNVLGQTANLKVKNQPLTEVFRILKEKIDVDFLYTQSQLQDALPVNIDVKDKSLKEILDLVFENQSLKYDLKNNTVIIKEKSNTINTNKKL